MTTDSVLALVAAIAATAFTLDLVWNQIRGPRPHIAAYGVGMAMFAAATWALWSGLEYGWTGLGYRIFFLFGAVLNIPVLAVGSMFLVVGRKSGNALTIFTGALGAIATTLVTTVPFARDLPASGLAEDIFPPISDGFGPRLLAAIGSGLGATLLITLALVSAIRYWRRDRRIVAGSSLIALGTLAGATGGTLLGVVGKTASFEISLLVTVTLIWLGYRVSRNRRRPRKASGPSKIVLVGPTSSEKHRAGILQMIGKLEAAGLEVMCPPRELEAWGTIGYSPAETMLKIFRAVEESSVVVADLAEGDSAQVVAGYARAVRVPVVVTAPEGTRIPRELRAIAIDEVYYVDPDEVAARVSRFLAPPEL